MGISWEVGGFGSRMAVVLFILAGLAEIGGGYLIWLSLRESKPVWYGLVGGVIFYRFIIIVGMAGR